MAAVAVVVLSMWDAWLLHMAHRARAALGFLSTVEVRLLTAVPGGGVVVVLPARELYVAPEEGSAAVMCASRPSF